MNRLHQRPTSAVSARLLPLALLLVLAGCHSATSGGGSAPGDMSKGSGSDKGQGQGATSGQGAGQADAQNGGSGRRNDQSGGAEAADVVRIVPDSQRRGGIEVGPVEVAEVPRTLAVTGQVVTDEAHTAHLGAVADGRITSVDVLPGAVVGRGQTLGTLHSHMVHETAGALAVAFAAVERQRGAVNFARQAQERYHHLFAIGAASQEESQRSDQGTQEAQKGLADAEANVRMEREHLSELLQVEPETITPNNLYARELVPMRAPLAGTVLARNVSVGQVVSTGFDAFDIASLATVWVTAAVNQADLGLVHTGAAARVRTRGASDPQAAGAVQGSADRAYPGRVAQIGDQLNMETRTVPVRIVVPNPGERLRPGMFATVEIAGPATAQALYVPERALEDINGMAVVFTTTDGQTFHARTVRTGTHAGGRVEVVEGLAAGDRVVVNGAFLVKSEMLKGTMGDG